MGTPPNAPGLWDEMIASAHAELTLVMTTGGHEPPSVGREQDLVNLAVAAGVLGALETFRRGVDS